MAGNRVVARYRDGRRVKGSTADFLPTRDAFHIQVDGGGVATVALRELKALFFVKDLVGDPAHQKTNRFVDEERVVGKKIRVTFFDGEVIVGTTQGYTPNRPGFFVVPADSDSNTDRCYVISAAAKSVELL